MKRIAAFAFAAVLVCAALVGCAQKDETYKDGTYTKSTEVDSHGGSYELTLKIKDGKIDDVDFVAYTQDENGNKVEKDENYGKGSGDENYAKAQAALAKLNTFAEQFMKNGGNLDDVDDTAGATAAFDAFKTLLEEALNEAKK